MRHQTITKGRVIKHMPFCSLYLRKGSSKIWCRIASRYFKTGVAYGAKDSVTLARIVAEQKWKEGLGIVPIVTKHIPTIREAHDEFMAMRRKNRAPKTIELDEYSFQKVFGISDYEINSANIVRDIESFLEHRELMASTRHLTLRTIWVFLSWCAKKTEPCYLEKIPRRQDFLPSVPPKNISIFQASEIEMIQNHLSSQGKYTMRLLIEFLVASACRIHEAIELTQSQLTANSILFVSKRGDKIEEVPRTERINNILAQLPARNDGNIFPYDMKSISRLRRILNDSMEAVGINHEARSLSFHNFRKTRISEFVRNGVPAATIAKVCRINFVTAMKHYVSISNAELMSTIESVDSASRIAV